MRTIYQPLALVALFSVAACSGAGSSNSAVPTGSSGQSAAQSQSRVLQNHNKPPAGGFTLFGDGVLVHPGHNSPTGVDASTNGSSTYGGVDFGAPVATFHDLTNLSTDVRLVSGANSCAFGSPRFDVGVTNGTASGDLFVTIPCDTVPVGTWSNSGNVFNCTDPLNGAPTCIFPSGGICGSSVPICYQGMTYAQAEGFYGSYTVTDIAIFVDPSNGAEDVQFDNTAINNLLFTYESKDTCMDGGWQQFTSPPGPFKNQGDCVSYFNNGK